MECYMKKCNNCGYEIEDGTIYCPYCGAKYDEKSENQGNASGYNGAAGGTYDPNYGYRPDYTGFDPRYGYTNGATRYEGESFWLAVLCFFIPLLGLILWYTWKISQPGKANSAAKGALASVCFGTPFIGLILWLMWKREKPDLAKTCGIAAIIGAVFAVVSTIFITVIGAVYGIYFY